MNYDFDQLVKLVKSGLNDDWISEYMNIDLSIVKQARDGTLQKPVRLPRPKRLTKRERLRSKLVPVSRPFPDLVGITDAERIITLTKHGLSARKIQTYLSAPHGLKAIGNYARRKLGPMRTGNSSAENWINPSTMPYVEFCLAQFGKDKYTCELCLERVPKGCLVHHTKYQGATVYDLMYICTSCNLARENKGLT